MLGVSVLFLSFLSKCFGVGMLKKLSFNNFYSFKEGVVIDFTLGKGVPENVWQAEGCSTVLGIKGANGSGKTNIIKALKFLSFFCTASYSSMKNTGNIRFLNHFDNDDSTFFEVLFSSYDSDFKYSLEVKKEGVIEESLQVFKKVWKTVYKRKEDKFIEVSNDIKSLGNYKIKNNSSVLSMLEVFDIEIEGPVNTLTDLYKASLFFSNISSNINLMGYDYSNREYVNVARDLYQDEDARGFVLKMLRKADSSIKKIEIIQTVNNDGEESYNTFFLHSRIEDSYSILYAFESSGTKKMFLDMGLYWNALRDGEVLALDEFDTHYHAMILPEIINLFESNESNPKNAQLIFTAHNTEIIDKLGRYRSIIVNKENSESYAYRLDEIPGSVLRNDRPISPTYLKGRIGGVPDV